jgi:hypothetical protein
VTCLRQGWVTRQKGVEVEADKGDLYAEAN